MEHSTQRRTALPLWAQVLIALVLGVCVGALLNGPGQWGERAVHQQELKVAQYKLKQAERDGLPTAELTGAVEEARLLVSSVAAPGWSEALMAVCETAGQLFLRLIKWIVVPLIFCSIVKSIADLGDITRLRRIGWKTVLYYSVTTALAVLLGLVLVNLLKPGGAGLAALSAGAPEVAEAAPPTPRELLLRIVPTNPVEALATGDSLQIIFSAILFGIGLGILHHRSREGETSAAGTTIAVMGSIADVTILIIQWILRLLPLAVLCLMARAVGQAGLELIAQLAKYMLTVVLGLALHGYVVLLAIFVLFTRRNPLRFLSRISEALVTSFSTASSSATLPVTMDRCERRVGVSERIASFVLPLGATVNMDGTALYESVAAMFIAQAYGIELSLGQQVMVFLTATLAAIGAAGIPEAGLVTMALVLNAVGLPLEGIGIIVAVDRVLDMCRTSVNVLGDAVGATIIAHSEGELAPPSDDVKEAA